MTKILFRIWINHFLVEVKSQWLFFQFDHFDQGRISEYSDYGCATPL